MSLSFLYFNIKNKYTLNFQEKNIKFQDIDGSRLLSTRKLKNVSFLSMVYNSTKSHSFLKICDNFFTLNFKNLYFIINKI